MPPDILVVRFSAIGDLLLTTPLLRAIRTRHPEARITFVTRDDMAGTLRNNPRITELVAWPRDGSLRHLAHKLRHHAWTHRLDLHGSLRSRALRILVGGRWTSYPKHRLRRWELISSHRRRGGNLGHVAERYFQAARGLDVRPDAGPPEFFVTPPARAAAEAFVLDRNLGMHRPLIGLAPGAAHFTKRWPLQHWIALAERLSATCDMVVLGGAAEREAADAIVAAVPVYAASAAGEVSLEGTAALLARCDRVVVGDTGVLHLATAVGTPVIGIYGPTVEEFGFFPYHARHVAVQHDLNCRPCSAQGGPVCPLGHHHCLELLPAGEVVAAMGQLP